MGFTCNAAGYGASEAIVQVSSLAEQPETDDLFDSYAQLAHSLLKGTDGACLLNAAFQSRGHAAGLKPERISKWLRALGWDKPLRREPISTAMGPEYWLTAVPLQQSDGTLLGVFCVRQHVEPAPASTGQHAAGVAAQLKPMLDCVHRDLAAALPKNSKEQTLTEQTAELEWLFQITNALTGPKDDRHLLEELLRAAAERLDCAFAVMSIPERRLSLQHDRDAATAPALRAVWKSTEEHLQSWAQRQKRPLMINSAGRSNKLFPPCKILSVPVARDNGRILGILAFYNPESAADFQSRHMFLARHLGKETGHLVESQFDLMTGLYTRDGLEQMYLNVPEESRQDSRSVVYIDIDHMHMVNDLHGFEVGNELIVRIADILAPPVLPHGALASRLSGDRFAVLMDGTDPRAAAVFAEKIQAAASRLAIGPAQSPVDVSISCGVAALVDMPQGFARAMAAAELACKTAKGRGRGRVELYACEDSSMMRRHDDAVAVGQLRGALKTDRLVLFAQRIEPVNRPGAPGGYELLLRMLAEDGSLVPPGPLIMAAQRYQLLPTIDRWVIQRSLQMLTPYRAMLKTSGLSMSINLSGQSLGDDACLEHFKEQLASANLPDGCLTVEITEQAAVTNLARAGAMIGELRKLGCKFALDDFGTGANTLTHLKNLQVSRVKIDGSFIRDILADRNSLATVKAIVELAKAMSLETVAEYVESDAILAAVRRLGVDYVQGYAIGKPQPLDVLLRDLDSDESRRMRRLHLEL
jgi:diguanylate cyclase (GGDEF)-like protein